ncbi:MAG: sulfatase [Akkermansiaceae bacterium]|nr:sulfatase [Akkermansiaceae bacterium]MCF7730977.1 sulfatase [Akkermansiaceae bacterium]
MPPTASTRRRVVPNLLTALLLSPLTVLHAAEDKVSKPNIVYVLADQWRASATGYAGDPNVKTPHLDHLAKESLNFRNAVSVCAVCTPHRAALMTGRFPTSTGMFLNDAHLPDSELCMAEILGAAGYATGYIGKWHLDGNGRCAYIPPSRRQGWDYWKGAECDHTYNHSHYYTGTSEVKHFWEGYDAFAQTKDAQQYLRDRARTKQPFILFVAYGTPHFPHDTAPAEFKALYPPDKIKLPPNVPAAMQAKARKEAQGYYAHCTALDRCIGDLLGTLADTGLATHTIFVFSSDHGEMLGSHGVPPRTKQVAWSEASQVPFLMRIPATGGRTVKTPLTTPDILPTLLGLAEVAVPDSVEGEDLSPIIRSGRDAERAALYMGVAPFISRQFANEYRAIRTNRYTYARQLDGPWLLFDNDTDPYQTNNLVDQPEHAAQARELEAQLQSRLERISEDFRPGSAHLAEWGYKVGPHGSVPYNDQNAKPQTPRRTPVEKPDPPVRYPAAR